MAESPFSVSVVLPVFNGGKYVSGAIDSVLAQTYPEWELLVVDDGSTDDTAAICDRYAAKDARIKVSHQPNGGVNSARAKGIGNAVGEYLTFLDADDTLTSDALELMVGGFGPEVDLVCCGVAAETLDQEAYIKVLWENKVEYGICTKMFRTALFKQMDYHLDRRIKMGEDLLLNSVYSLGIRQAVILPQSVYVINKENDASVTKNFKRSWEYEKFYYGKVEELFLSKCAEMESYGQIRQLVYESWVNGLKIVLMDGNRIDYNDAGFAQVSSYFSDKMETLLPSEKLIFKLKAPRLYRAIMKLYRLISDK